MYKGKKKGHNNGKFFLTVKGFDLKRLQKEIIGGSEWNYFTGFLPEKKCVKSFSKDKARVSMKWW